MTEVIVLNNQIEISDRNNHIRIDNIKKVHINTDITIHVFCPESLITNLEDLFKKNNIRVDFNNCATFPRNNHYYVHYISKLLNSDSKEFLIQKIKLGYHVQPLVDYLDKKFKYTFIELLNSDYFLHRTSFSSLRNKNLWMTKRIIDIVLSLILLLITFPLMICIALIIKLDSKGPVFFKQERIGKFNIPFQIYKFRSMDINAEKNGAQWALINDDRVTRVGKWIRLLRLDELPQLFNVIKGDMSLVGPRPEREVFVKELEKDIAYYRFRHAVKPGITGWAQVNYPYGASLNDAKWKHKYDVWYIKHQTLFLDIKVLFKTIKVVFLGKGR